MPWQRQSTPDKSARSCRSSAPCSTSSSSRSTCPSSTTRSRSTPRRTPARRSASTVEVQQHIGRNQVRAVAMSSTDAVVRGMEVVDTGAAISVPVGAPALGRILNVLGEPVDNGAPIPKDALRWPIHRKRPDFVNLEPKTEVFETGIKVVDLIAPVREGRQDRPLRRRRRRQDRRHHGAHQQRREGPRRQVRVLRRGRAHARRQRPVPRDEGERRHRLLRADLRPDERAAGSAPPRRPVGPHRRRVLPRRRERRRARVHRQHLPLHAGGLGSVGAARPHAERGGLPADAGDGDGRPAGAHHLDAQRLDHVGAGDLRSRRRHHRSGAGDRVRAPRRHGRALARDHGARHLSGRRSARVEQPHPRSAVHRRAPLQGGDRRAEASCSATRSSRTSSPSSAWTSSPKTTRRSSAARAACSASCRSRSRSPSSSPASRAST